VITRRLLTIGSVLLGLACAVSGGTTGAADGTLSVGTWGADDRGVIVEANRVHVHIGCTRGDFSFPVVDAQGRFTVDGSYTLRAFPVARESLPAQMSGVVEGRRLIFTIAVSDTVVGKPVALGPITVTLGVAPRMANCPICQKPGV
jgi:hypothetical protein